MCQYNFPAAASIHTWDAWKKTIINRLDAMKFWIYNLRDHPTAIWQIVNTSALFISVWVEENWWNFNSLSVRYAFALMNLSAKYANNKIYRVINRKRWNDFWWKYAFSFAQYSNNIFVLFVIWCEKKKSKSWSDSLVDWISVAYYRLLSYGKAI